MKNKKTLFLIVSLIIIITVFVSLIFINYLKPIKFNDYILKDIKVDVKLKNKFNSCLVELNIKNKIEYKEIKKDLMDDGYKNNNNIYSKKIKLKEKCNSIYKQFKKNKVVFKLIGNEKETIEVKNKYDDSLYEFNGRKNKVTKISEVDENKLGIQYVIYKLEGKIYNKYLIRTVEVKDTTSPIISLKGKTELILYKGDKYVEPGYSAEDNYDGDITKSVTVEGNIDINKEGKYELIYKLKDSSNNSSEVKRIITVKNRVSTIYYSNTEVKGLTYIKGILVVNKRYGLPKNYNPGVDKTASTALSKMQSDASALGLNLRLLSGFRSYKTQYNLYNSYIKRYGQKLTDTFSARPGYSEHQTGLAFDVGEINDNFGNTASGRWLAENCHLYGFIIRYPKGKQNITGYKYEPWHIRYLGTEVATKVKNSGLTLEEYLGIN